MSGVPSLLVALSTLEDERALETEAAARAVAEAEAEIATALAACPAHGRGVEPPPRGLTARMEAFCQAYAAHPVGAQAAVEAGYARLSARKIGSRLLRVPAVAERIAQLRRAVAASCADERSALIAKLESVIAGAIEDRNWSAAARGIALQAAIAGLAHADAQDVPALPAPGGGPVRSETPGGQLRTNEDV